MTLAHDAAPLAAMRAFCNQKLALSDRDLYTITWPEVLQRVVHLQATTRLSISRDLNEHDIVARILRKENYLTGMVNRDVLRLSLDVPGMRDHRWFTKVIEWNIDLAVFHGMFDEHFNIRPSFYDVTALRHRFRCLAVINAILSPFVAIFLSMYFVLSYAEKFYNTPSTVGARDWSSYAYWRMREFNELPHFTQQRLAAAYPHAKKYVAQFPSPVVNIVAKFVSYVIGSFAACALFCAVVDDRLLQAYIGDRDLLWVTAVLGTILASSRALMATENAVFEPNAVMSKIVSHTHYLPKHWRDAAHKEDVQGEFNAFFSLKSAMFLEEIASVFAAPFVLWFPLCDSADDIIQFVRQFTTNKSGVGDICSLSAFDFNRHGNKNYGAPSHAEKSNRSRQGKMEKSFLTFQATYPTWEPDTSGRNMLNSLNGFSNTNESALGKSADLSASVLKRSFHNLKDAPTSSKGDVRHRFDRGSSHRPPAHGSGSMFHPSFISDTQELHTLSETLSASQTVLQHFYEEQMEDTIRDDTAARTSPTRDDAMSEHEKVEVPTIDQIQMYQRPPPSITPLTTFPEEIPLVRAQNGAPSVLDSCVLPTSTVLPAIERDDNILDL
jgi:autophagy-related protein 9